MPNIPVEYDDVEVLQTSAFGFWCRIPGHKMTVFVGAIVPTRGTTIRGVGDRGRLVVPKWFAEDEGLPVPAEDLVDARNGRRREHS